ncbi:MAG TPA: ferritin-like domain-containing protein [Candidatus Kapabacteria bacterium]|jgi:ferritin-like metal-binding protein YciE
MPKVNNLQDVYIDELRDLYNMETQITKALPRVIKSVTNPELKQALENHLEETEGQVERLEQVFEMAGQKARGKKCTAMEGIIEEAKDLMAMDINESVLDAALIGGCQKVEHYEIAGYGTVIAWARQLGFDDQAELLEQTLEQEKAANEKLNQIALEIVNETAEQGESAFVSSDGFQGHVSRNGKH